MYLQKLPSKNLSCKSKNIKDDKLSIMIDSNNDDGDNNSKETTTTTSTSTYARKLIKNEISSNNSSIKTRKRNKFKKIFK